MVEPVAMEVAADVAHGLGHWKLSGGLGQWKLTRTMYPFIVVQRNILLESWHLVEIGVQRRWESVEHGPCYRTWTMYDTGLLSKKKLKAGLQLVPLVIFHLRS